MSGGRRVAVDAAVDDGDVAQRAQPAGHIGGHLIAHRAARQRHHGVEVGVDAAGPAAGIIRDGAVDEVQRCPVAILDAAATLPEVAGGGGHGVIDHSDMVEGEIPVVQDAARQLVAIAGATDNFLNSMVTYLLFPNEQCVLRPLPVSSQPSS